MWIYDIYLLWNINKEKGIRSIRRENRQKVNRMWNVRVRKSRLALEASKGLCDIKLEYSQHVYIRTLDVHRRVYSRVSPSMESASTRLEYQFLFRSFVKEESIFMRPHTHTLEGCIIVRRIEFFSIYRPIDYHII